MIINCIEIAQKIELNLIEIIKLLKNKYKINPKLVIIKISDDLASDRYIKHKINKANELGIQSELIILRENTSNEQIFELIQELNKNNDIHGIIVQLPVYKHIDKELIFNNIDPLKDVDGLSFLSNGKLWSSKKDNLIVPCTVNGVIQVIDSVDYNLHGKHVVIINRSNIVGKPLASQILKKNATVTICHRYTDNLINFTKNADVIISAVGIKDFIKPNMIKKDSFIIDVGISVINNKIYGDCQTELLKDYVKYITPVPNGIGKLTVINVYYNLIKLIINKYKLNIKI